MNHKFVNNSAKAIAIAVTAAMLIAGNPSGSYANNMKGNEFTYVSDDQVSVKYIGTRDNDLLFHVQFDNPTGQKFAVIVKDDAGFVIYEEKFSDTKFSKNFRLPKQEGVMHTTFVVRTGKKDVESSFVVNTTLTENIEVTKL